MMESARAMITTSADGIQKVYTYLFYVGINLKCTRACLRAWGIFDFTIGQKSFNIARSQNSEEFCGFRLQILVIRRK